MATSDNKCPNGVCNSDHGPDEYAVGYFVVGDVGAETVLPIKGEQAAHDYGLKSKLQIFWTEAGAEDAIKRLDPTTKIDPYTGAVEATV